MLLESCEGENVQQNVVLGLVPASRVRDGSWWKTILKSQSDVGERFG